MKIQKFLGTKEMTQTAFLKECSINSNSFRNFMKYKGEYTGIDNQTYRGALRFFDKREKQNKENKGTATPENRNIAKLQKQEKKLEGVNFLEKLDAIYEEGPIFDDCEDVRKKILALIGSGILTQKKITEVLKCTAASLKNFLKVKGKFEGRGCKVYYTGYHLFERVRIAEDKPKTKKRMKAEKEFPQGYPNKPNERFYYAFAKT